MVISQGTVSQQLESNLRAATHPSLQFEGGRIDCLSCGQSYPFQSRFCTNCGMPAGYQAQAPAAAEVRSTPGFAEVHKNHSHFIPQELQEEMGELLVALARQRFFLYFHWLVFLGSHALGFLMAFWCYQEFQGDEVNKIFMSLPPLFFINLAAFFCLPPIKTTRFEISRLKERLTYLHFRIEYRHLL